MNTLLFRRLTRYGCSAMLIMAAASVMPRPGIAQEISSDSEAPDIQPVAVGDQAPDFDLPTFDDKTVKLSDRFGEQGKPVVLLFSRAFW